MTALLRLHIIPPVLQLICFDMNKFLYLFTVLALLIATSGVALAQESGNGYYKKQSGYEQESSESSRGPAGGSAIRWNDSRPDDGDSGESSSGESEANTTPESTSEPAPSISPVDETPADAPVESDNGGEVLSEEACGQYLYEYIHIQKENNPEEVTKLQLFLNDYMQKGLEINGVYDTVTFDTVKEFQVKEKEEVLEPWGIDEPTGYVYITTQRRINNIKCPELDLPMPDWLAADTNIHDNV